MVHIKLDTQNALNAAYYLPRGARGVGLARAQGYSTSIYEYKKWLAEFAIVIIQIENIDAVNNLEEILQVDGIDGFIVGTYELSSSLGHVGDYTNPLILDALDRIKEKSNNFSVTSVFHVISLILIMYSL
jgi:2-keto-3-deoxy-L-rhamnonate aldolase RhmA